MSSLGGLFDSVKARAEGALDRVEGAASEVASEVRSDVAAARSRLGKAFGPRPLVPTPDPPPGPEAKAAAIERILEGGVPNGIPVVSRVLGPLGNETAPVLEIIRSCGGAAELDAVISRVGRRRLLDALESVEGTATVVAAAIDEVRARDVRPGDWEGFDRYLDEATGSASRPGNRVTLLEKGPEAFQEIWRTIDGAQSSVNVSSYQIEDDATGREYARHLVDAARRGVTVNVITDKQANVMVGGHSIVKFLRQNGVNVIENPGEPLMGSMDHRKFAVVDGQTGFCGGMNIGDKYAKSEWRDMHSELLGPAVADLQRAFLERWGELGGKTRRSVEYFPPLAAQGDEAVRVLAHRGGAGGDESIRLAYLRAIDTAASAIRIEDPFFVDAEVLDHLERAALRGVDVSVIWPGDNINPAQQLAARSRYASLIAAGVKVYELPGMTHAKVCTIDGRFATIGSSNLDQRALQRDFEMNLVVRDAAFVGSLTAALDRDLARSKRITEAPRDLVHKLLDPALRDPLTEKGIGRLP